MAAIMLEIGYGHTVSSLGDDEFIKLVEDGVRKCLSGSGPGATLVDFFPIRAVSLPLCVIIRPDYPARHCLQFATFLLGFLGWSSSVQQRLRARRYEIWKQFHTAKL